jgi:hypothetical protein
MNMKEAGFDVWVQLVGMLSVLAGLLFVLTIKVLKPIYRY